MKEISTDYIFRNNTEYDHPDLRLLKVIYLGCNISSQILNSYFATLMLVLQQDILIVSEDLVQEYYGRYFGFNLKCLRCAAREMNEKGQRGEWQ